MLYRFFFFTFQDERPAARFNMDASFFKYLRYAAKGLYNKAVDTYRRYFFRPAVYRSESVKMQRPFDVPLKLDLSQAFIYGKNINIRIYY